jgi:hypothetical protein
MKTTIVPAQITTVEDKVAGNITFTQLLLMIVPVFFSGAIFTFAPPFMSLTAVKASIVGAVAFTFLTLAIRIRGRLVLEWIVIRFRYNLRPRYIVFQKNDMYLRPYFNDTAAQQDGEPQTDAAGAIAPWTDIGVTALVQYESMITDPNTAIHFERTKKGGLRVHVKQTE